jgi:hypothetical protein
LKVFFDGKKTRMPTFGAFQRSLAERRVFVAPKIVLVTQTEDENERRSPHEHTNYSQVFGDDHERSNAAAKAWDRRNRTARERDRRRVQDATECPVVSSEC